MEDTLYMLDALSSGREKRFTSFAHHPEMLLKDMQEWIQKESIDKLRFADIFEVELEVGKRPTHCGKILLQPDGSLHVISSCGSRLNPYRRGRGTEGRSLKKVVNKTILVYILSELKQNRPDSKPSA